MVRLCIEKHDIFLSEYVLEEMARHLVEKFGTTSDELDATLALLRAETQVVEPAAVPIDSCRDPKDLPILGTALAAGADYLVTGDNDLLVLQQFQNIPILSPRTFYDRIRA